MSGASTLITAINLSQLIAENASSGVIGLIVGSALAWLARISLRKRPTRRLFGVSTLDHTALVIGAPLGVTPGSPVLVPIGSGLPVFGYGPLMAYSRITHLMRNAYSSHNALTPYSSRDFPSGRLGDDLVLFGYPIGNEVTATVMAELRLPLAFDGHDLVDTTSGEILYQADLENGSVVRDYGYLLRAPNPFSEGHTVLLFAGCETYGVKGAADFFTLRNFHLLRGLDALRFGRLVAALDWLIPDRLKASYFVAVVEIEVRGTFTSTPRIVRFQKLDPDQVLARASL